MKVLAISVLLMVCAGCGRMSEDSQPDLPAPSQPAVQPIFSEQLVCVVDSHEWRWQHMYRLDLVQNQAEFVGGFGQRIVALRSQAMSVSPEFFKATFPATDQTNNAEFKVTIQRDDLSYRLEGAKLAAMLGDSTPARLAGRCSILDGRGFLTGEREGVRLRQTRRNHDKAMAAAMML